MLKYGIDPQMETDMSDQPRFETVLPQLAALAATVTKAVNDTEDNPDLVAVLKVYHALDTHYKALDAIRKDIYKALDKMDKFILPTKFEANGTDLVRIPELARSFYPTTKYSAKVVDKEKLYAWLREVGQSDVITETVNASTLAGLLKDMTLNQGIDAPEDVALLTTYQSIGSSKYTPRD